MYHSPLSGHLQTTLRCGGTWTSRKKIYAGAGAGIAICSTFERFKAALPQVPHPSVSAGTVKYAEYDTCELAQFSEERAFMKRRCFVFENEFRGFIHDYRAKTPGVEVPVDINVLVERV